MKNELQIVTISCFPARRQKTELTGIGAQKNQPVDNDWASTLIVAWEIEKKMEIPAASADIEAFPCR